MKKIFIALLLCFAFSSSFANDTLKVMCYNLLKYGISMPGCTNPLSTKNSNLALVIADYRPDIFVVNELAPDELYANNILINALQPVNGNYQKATLTNNATADETNMLFFDSQKLGLRSQTVINHYLRDLNVYTLFYRDGTLPQTQDTIFLHVIAAHLKAGSTGTDQTIREDQATLIMNYMNAQGTPGNYLLMGDFNVQSSTEASYQVFVADPDPDIRFYDPVNAPGSWNSNSAFKAVHTQSTRVSSLADCGSSGGMDDRFDFILASNQIIQGTDRVQYIGGSYWAFGNDSNHYNQSINSPANTSVTGSVANALYSISDHLPITLKLQIDGSLVSNAQGFSHEKPAFYCAIESNASPNSIPKLVIQNNTNIFHPSATVRMMDLNGRQVQSFEVDLTWGKEVYPLPIEGFSKGSYLVEVRVAPVFRQVLRLGIF